MICLALVCAGLSKFPGHRDENHLPHQAKATQSPSQLNHLRQISPAQYVMYIPCHPIGQTFSIIMNIPKTLYIPSLYEHLV